MYKSSRKCRVEKPSSSSQKKRRKSKIPRPPPPPWINLPPDLTARILQKVGVMDILVNAQRVCSTWRKVSLDPSMWRIIDLSNIGDFMTRYDLDIVCRQAVDRSQGQLVDIDIECFGCSELILYVAQRSSQLKRIRMVGAYGSIDDTEFKEAVKELPLLEELHFYTTFISGEAIEEVGNLCPMLKSFTYNKLGYRSPEEEYDGEALAVAKSMPQVRHLSLFGNKMTNEGLIAILNGCPNLESLDLRWCTNIKLEGSLGKRCAQQIKYVRYPNDSTEDYEFIASLEELNTLAASQPRPDCQDRIFSTWGSW